MNKKYDLHFLRACREKWYDISEDAVGEKSREQFRARKKAVNMYIDGRKLFEIERETGIKKTHIAALTDKCMQLDQDGNYYGYYALIPFATRKLSTGADGVFLALIKKYPELHEFLIGNYSGDKKYTLEKNISFKKLHEKFLAKCKQLGIQEYEYPFNNVSNGYISMISYIKRVTTKNVELEKHRLTKDAAQKLRSTGQGVRFTCTCIIPFHCVQFDGHKLDFGYYVEIVHDDGTVSKIMAERMWFLPVIDESTRCILGFYHTQSTNYNQYEVLEAIKRSILPHENINLTIPGLKYPDNGGFPSTAIPELKYAMFDIVMVDNAKAHLAANTVNKIVETLKCEIQFGSVATPETRGIVERFFGTIEERGFHRLPGTTGSNPRDPRRTAPEKEVIKYDITYEKVIQLLTVLCAEYNNTPHKALNNETPLEALKRKIANPFFSPTIADADMIARIEKLTHFTVQATVRGNIKNGKRPYIQYMNAVYRNDVLAMDSGLIGKRITIEVDPDDLRYLDAYTDDGRPLGTLSAAGGYGRTKHSIKTRKAASKFASETGSRNRPFFDPIGDYAAALAEQAKTSRRAATKADQVRRAAAESENADTSDIVISDEVTVKEQNNAKAIAIKTEVINGTVVRRPMTMEEFIQENRII